jgi:hypothetical protein
MQQERRQHSQLPVLVHPLLELLVVLPPLLHRQLWLQAQPSLTLLLLARRVTLLQVFLL